jgi:hypothetical protein
MTWQAEFLAKASEAHRVYEEAAALIKEMIQEDAEEGLDWNAALSRQFSAFEAWSALYREYANVLSKGGNAGRSL